MEEDGVKRQKSVYLTWEQIQEICAEVIRKIIGREVKVWASSDEPHLRSWALYFGQNSELTRDEITQLMDILQADDHDRDANDFDEYPVTELTSGLALKMLNEKLVMTTEKSFPDDNGVCFLLTATNPAVLRLLMEYPEVDCMPDVVAIPLTAEHEQGELKRLAETLVRQINVEHVDEDLMDRVDLFITALEEKLQTEVEVFSIGGVLDMLLEN